MRSQLLCTFTKRNMLYDTLDLIVDYHDILFNKIYVFQNEDSYHQMMCTYNVEDTGDNFIANEDTISLHRKKHSNTLYTINALNELIRKENNGILDKKFPIKWENYRNRLLLTNKEGFTIIPTRVYSIITVSEWKNRLQN